MSLPKYPEWSEVKQIQNSNKVLTDLLKTINRENNTTRTTNNLTKLFKDVWEKKEKFIENKKINTETLILIKKYLVWYNIQKHAEKWLNNFINLPEETKNNLWKLVKIFDNIDWWIVWWLWIKESKFEVKAESSKWAKWIFQVKIFDDLNKHFNSTNKYKWSEEKFLSNLKNNPDFVEIYKKMPREALWIAFLSFLIDKYDWNLVKAFWYYNSWQDKYSKWWKETKEYVYWSKSVLKYWKVFYLAINQLK